MVRNSEALLPLNQEDSDIVIIHSDPEEKPALTSPIGAKIIMYVLGAIGAGAGVLYWVASEQCAVSETCGKTLVDFLAEQFSLSAEAATSAAKWLLFLSGCIGYSGSNIYLSSRFYDEFVEYMAQQPTTAAKVGKGSLVIVSGIVQTAQLFLAVIATGGEIVSLPMALTVGGAFPGNLSGSVGLIKNTMPTLYANLKNLKNNMYYAVHTPKTQSELMERNRLKYYRRQQVLFLQQVEANFKKLVANARNLEVVSPINSLDYLFSQNAQPMPESNLVHLSNAIFKIGGLGLGANFLYPLIKGTFDILIDDMPYMAALALTAMLSSAMIYNGINYTVGALENSYRHLKNMLHCRPFDSLAYQLHPKTMMLASSLCITISILSYGVVNMLWDKGYNWLAKDELRHSARAGVDIYHAYALILFCITLLGRLTRNPSAKELFKIEQDVARIQMQSTQDFMKFIESSDAEKRQLYGVKAYAEFAVEDNAVELAARENNNEEPINSKPHVAKKGGWCSWLYGSRYKVEEEETVGSNAEHESKNENDLLNGAHNKSEAPAQEPPKRGDWSFGLLSWMTRAPKVDAGLNSHQGQQRLLN